MCGICSMTYPDNPVPPPHLQLFKYYVNPAIHEGRANWKHAFYNVLANVNKPMWILIVVVVWYAQGAFRSILDSSLYRVTWANFVQDPCWADASFLVETASTISQTCVNITSAHNLFSQASNNYRYYEAGKKKDKDWYQFLHGKRDTYTHVSCTPLEGIVF